MWWWQTARLAQWRRGLQWNSQTVHSLNCVRVLSEAPDGNEGKCSMRRRKTLTGHVCMDTNTLTTLSSHCLCRGQSTLAIPGLCWGQSTLTIPGLCGWQSTLAIPGLCRWQSILAIPGLCGWQSTLAIPGLCGDRNMDKTDCVETKHGLHWLRKDQNMDYTDCVETKTHWLDSQTKTWTRMIAWRSKHWLSRQCGDWNTDVTVCVKTKTLAKPSVRRLKHWCHRLCEDQNTG